MLTVGNVEILALHDNESALPLSMTFPDVPAEAWTPYQQKYPEGFDGTWFGKVVRADGRRYWQGI